jgi:hypothetical protein
MSIAAKYLERFANSDSAILNNSEGISTITSAKDWPIYFSKG